MAGTNTLLNKPGDIEAIISSQRNKERNYWLNKMSGELEKSTFPADNPGISSQEHRYHFDKVPFKLEGEIYSRLMKLCNESDPALFVVLLTGVVVLIGRYSDSNDITIGIPIIKQEVEARHIINTVLLLRNSMNNSMTFKELILSVRRNISEATENQNYPLELLLNDLDPGYPGNEISLFDIAVLLENIHTRTYLQDIKLNILVSFLRSGEAIEGIIEYNSFLYSKETIERIIAHFKNLLTAALSNLGVPLSTIDILSAREKNLVLNDFNRTKALFPEEKNIHELFEEQVKKVPDNMALAYEDTRVTYKELSRRSNRFAVVLRQWGLKPGAVAAIMIERSPALLEWIFAILKAGGAYLPISLKYPRKRIKYILEDSQAALLLTRESLFNKTGSICEVIDITGIKPGMDMEGRGIGFNTNCSSNAAYVIYTSGSTGEPKGVIVEHRNVNNLVLGLNDRVYNRYDRFLNVCMVAPIEFDASGQQIYGALLQGHCLYIVPGEVRLDGAGLIEYYKKFQVDVSDGTPSHVRLILASTNGRKLELNVKHFLVAGEEFPGKVAGAFLDALKNSSASVTNFYGPTETCVDSTSFEISKENMDLYHTIPIGKPLLNEHVYILGRENQLQPVGVPGELCIGGAGVGRGYLNRDQLTNERFIVNPFGKKDRLYKTGDLARWLSDGNIEFLGRMDNQVKLRGYRIELGEIENKLLKFAPVKDAVVLIRQDNSGESKLTAYVIPDPTNAAVVREMLHLEQERKLMGKQNCELPNGMTVFYINMLEVDNQYREIFEEACYLKNGIKLEEGACIFDVGANIGMFSLFVNQICTGVEIYAFEPIPATYEILRLNLSLYGLNAKLSRCGISSKQEGEAVFSYYPNSPAFSSLFRISEKEYKTIKAFLRSRQSFEEDQETLSDEQVQEILADRLNEEKVSCPLKTISQVIEENRVERIDLLKIDVEKAELEVLKGIDDKDWEKIRQLVMEVHNIDGRLDGIVNLLKSYGYKVVVEKDLFYEDSMLYTIYAALSPGDDTGMEEEIAHVNRYHENNWSNPGRMLKELKSYLQGKLPDYMIPSEFVLLNVFPLTANGKIDRKAMLSLQIKFAKELPGKDTGSRDELDRKLLDIWAEILDIDKGIIGLDTDFFELGGHSLRATMMVSGIHKELGVKLPLTEIFKSPTIRGIAQYLRKHHQYKFVLIEAAEKRDYYALSPGEKRMYFMQKFSPRGTSYNMPQIVVMEGEVQVEKIESTFKKLIHRHETLRTSFNHLDEEPIQRIYHDVEFSIEYYETDEAQAKKIRENFVRPFDLGEAPLLRVGLIKIKKNQYKHILMVDMHHIISDGVSNRIIIQDFERVFRDPRLPALKLQYKDFSQWQNRLLNSGQMEKQEEFWLKRFKGGIPALEIPIDYPRPGVRDINKGDTIRFNLEKGLSKKLYDVGKKTETTLYMVLSAVYFILLFKYTRQEDIVVGTPVTGRSHPDLQDVMGVFLNMLAMRNQPRGNKTFGAFLEEVKENALNAYKNQDYQFDRLIIKLGLQGEAGRNPLFETEFAVNNMDIDSMELPGLKLKLCTNETDFAKFDLYFLAVETGDSIRLVVRYSTELFKRSTAARIAKHYTEILEQVAEDPDISLETIALSHEYETSKSSICEDDDNRDFDL